ncbi:MAG: zf-HC2 domain-containing protein [Terriglobia bacterium]
MKTPKTCVEKERLFAYVHHMLHGDEAGRIARHLELCAECRESVAAFERVDSVLGEWKPAEPSPWFDARARARIAAGAEARFWRFAPHLRWRAWVGVAAVAVLAIVAGVAVSRPPRSTRGVQEKAAIEAAAVKAVVKAPSPAAVEETGETGEAGGTLTVAQSQPANQEIDLYKNLNVLENYDMLANFDVLSEIPQADSGSSD